MPTNAERDQWSVQTPSTAVILTAHPNPDVSRARRTTAATLITRRSLLRTSFWAGAGVTGAGLLLGFMNYFWPRQAAGFGGVITVPAGQVPRPGQDPRRFPEGKFYLVNLRPGDGVPDAFASVAAPSATGGILALWQKCPHLGCTVPWRPEFSATETKGLKGWFRCPCHGSTYTKAGVRVDGPATRSMDLFAVRVNRDGSVQVDTSQVTLGSTENPRRAIPGEVAPS